MSTSGELPVGTVTFLFTDIEGSTRLLKLSEETATARRSWIIRPSASDLCRARGPRDRHQGDSFFVAFRRAKDAVAAAITCQRRLAEHAWPDGTELRVRMGIHTGEPAMGGERYVGMGYRAARICAAGHGGQVLLSQTARELLRDDPVPDVSLRDLGEHRLKDMDEPERLYQLVAPGLREGFPELKTAAPPPSRVAKVSSRRPRRKRSPGLAAARAAGADRRDLRGRAVGVAFGVLSTQGGGSTASASIAERRRK